MLSMMAPSTTRTARIVRRRSILRSSFCRAMLGNSGGLSHHRQFALSKAQWQNRSHPHDDVRTIRQWEQSVQPLSSSEQSATASRGGSASGKTKLSAENNALARADRSEAVRAAWDRMSAEEKAVYRGSFRRYRKQWLAIRLAPSQSKK